MLSRKTVSLNIIACISEVGFVLLASTVSTPTQANDKDRAYYYDLMKPYCMSKQDVDEEREAEYDGTIPPKGYYESFEGYNPDLGLVEQNRDNLDNSLGPKIFLPRQSSYFFLRGILNVILGQDFRALGDLAQAKRACPTVPIEGHLTWLYKDLGFEKKAVQMANVIPCSDSEQS